MNYSNAQRQIINSSAKNIVVIAASAAGKTACLAARTARLLNEGATPERMALMTFTNMAAEEMSQRIGKHDGMYIGTIHGYANQLLLRYGIDTSDLLVSENFDDLFELALDNPGCAKPLDYLLVDEAQDLTELEYQFIFDVLKPKSFFIIGDHRQSIYQFRGSRPDLFLSLCDREDTVTFNLKENYRNAKEILYFAKGIINKIGYKFVDESIPISNIDGKVIEREFDISSIISLIHNSVTRGYSQYKDWFILCRFNETLNLVYQTLQKNGFPVETFKRSGMSNAEMEISLNNNTIKVLTIHAAKGLEADNVIVLGAKFYSDEERRISYVAATRAKKKLFWYNIKPKKKKKDMSWE